MLRLCVRQPGGWFYYIYRMQRISTQKITVNITHQDSCQVVCFFIGPGGYRLLQCADIQHYQYFITCQVVWKVRNVASEHINIVKRRKKPVRKEADSRFSLRNIWLFRQSPPFAQVLRNSLTGHCRWPATWQIGLQVYDIEDMQPIVRGLLSNSSRQRVLYLWFSGW